MIYNNFRIIEEWSRSGAMVWKVARGDEGEG